MLELLKMMAGTDDEIVQDALENIVKRTTCIRNIKGKFEEVYPALRKVFTSLPDKEIVETGLLKDRSALLDWEAVTREEERLSQENEYSYNDYYASLNIHKDGRGVDIYTGTSGREISVRNYHGELEVSVDFTHGALSTYGSLTAASQVIKYIKYHTPDTSAMFATHFDEYNVADLKLTPSDLLWLRRGDSAEDNTSYQNATDEDDLDSVMSMYVPAWYADYLQYAGA